MTDQEGLIKLLNDPQLKPLLPSATGSLSLSSCDAGDVDWQDDPVPIKLEKIRSVLLNSKTADEIATEASMMPVGMWLDLVVKLMPKNIQVSGDINFQHMLADLGPIDKDQYRLTKNETGTYTLPQPKAGE